MLPIIADPVLHSSGAWIASTAASGYVASTLSSTWVGAAKCSCACSEFQDAGDRAVCCGGQAPAAPTAAPTAVQTQPPSPHHSSIQ